MRLNTWYEAGMLAAVLLAYGCGGETLVPLPSKFQAVVTGAIHTCGVVTDGAAFCWGDNRYGQLGDGSRKSRVYPTPVVGTTRYLALSGGGGHTCGISTAGTAYCWGFNQNGQLGDGTLTDRATPAPVDGGKTWLSLSAGGSYSCGIATDSLAYCWGWNGTGQLGDGTESDSPTPVAVSGGHKFRSVSANAHHTCGLTGDGEIYCWGRNDDGQLGSGNTDASAVPVLVTGGLTWSALSAGFSHTCGVAADGRGYCWGRNQFGQLGLSDSVGGASETVPFPMAGELAWASLDLGAYFSCGTEAQLGAAYCWGYNGSGQLGAEAPDICVDEQGRQSQCALAPLAVSSGLTFATISAHTQHTCGLSLDGFAYCWGSGTNGQLGNGEKGEQVFSVAPVKVAGQP